MTVSPRKRTMVGRLRSSPKRGKGDSLEEDWHSAANFPFSESPTLPKKTQTKRGKPSSAASRSHKETTQQTRRQSVLLKRLDLPTNLTGVSPGSTARKTRRQSMVHLSISETERREIQNNKLLLPVAEKSSSRKVSRSKLPPSKPAPPKQETNTEKKDIVKTKLQEKEIKKTMTKPKSKGSLVNQNDFARRKSLRSFGLAGNMFEDRTKRKAGTEVTNEVQPAAKKRKAEPSSYKKAEVAQINLFSPKLRKAKYCTSPLVKQEKTFKPETLSRTKNTSPSVRLNRKTAKSASLSQIKSVTPSPSSRTKVSSTTKFSNSRQTRGSITNLVTVTKRESLPRTPNFLSKKDGETPSPSPRFSRVTRSSVKSKKRVKLIVKSPKAESPVLGFRKTPASNRKVQANHVSAQGSSVLPTARMQLEYIRHSSPLRSTSKVANSRVKPYTPKPDPAPSHILKQTLKKKVEQDLDVVTLVDVHKENGDCNSPSRLIARYVDVPVVVPSTPSSTHNLPPTPKSSRQHQTPSSTSRWCVEPRRALNVGMVTEATSLPSVKSSVESSRSLTTMSCQQTLCQATPRSSTPIEDESRLDALTGVDTMVKDSNKVCLEDASVESSSPCISEDEEEDDDNDDDSDDDDDDDNDDDNDDPTESEETQQSSRKSYCVLM
ncbi:serine/arginine repetitive matrix protein 1-like isoform X2 [Homarus americanus]|nr:serine/arginine repetitive matrix protein 1-like isoform X2 [Homarus americanus]XP_042214308.1 serine/arginine repetitive matrix protein 1-like isoform X2 [Homarus americanus]